MQRVDTRWLPAIAWLASDRLLLDQTNPPLDLAIKDYQQYVDSQLRKEDIALMIKSWQVNDKPLEVSLCLSGLCEHFLQWQGDRFEVKDQQLEAWLALCSLVDPSWIIAWGYRQLLLDGILDIAELEQLIGHNQCPLALQKPPSFKSYADNHVHLGGHGHYSLSLLDITLYMDQKPNTDDSQWPYRAEYTLLEGVCELSKSTLPTLVAVLGRDLLKQLFGHGPKPLEITELDQYSLGSALQLELEQGQFATHEQKLAAHAHLSECPSVNRWLLLCTSLLCHPFDISAPHRQLEQFIRAANVLRNYMVVSGVGLGQFVEYFGFKQRKPTSHNTRLNAKAAALAFDSQSNISRQFRISPDLVVSAKSAKKPMRVAPKQLKSMVELLQAQGSANNTHFVIHFTRGLPKNYQPGDNRLNDTRQKLREQVSKLAQFATSVDYGQQTLNGSEQTVDLRQLIRGYDVAGNENHLPIEVFAPALRVLRSAQYCAKGPFTSRFAKPFLTVHAGEDFSHLPTGLRAIDEAVTFCDFEQGDRLGHALALGLDVQQWAKRQKRVYLSVGQHFDNLVWTYHQALQLAQYCGEFNAVTQLLEHKIQHWADYLGLSQYSCQQFYQAWLLRRNCPVSYTQNPKVMVEPLWVPDIDRLNNGLSGKPRQLWLDYVNGDLPASGSREHVVTVCCCPTDDNLMNGHQSSQLSDNLSPGELKLYEAIQDMLMDKYSRKGIIIEACPTSNIYIGRFKEYHEHPIFRWDPPNTDWLKSGQRFNRYGLRRGAVPVCINTDDSALMPTTIANEHRVIEKAAIEHFGIGTNTAEQWIERIRQKGVAIFRDKHLRS